MERSAALCEQAAQALRDSPIPALRHVSVEENEARLVLRGELPSYYYKQLAQETLMPLLGGRECVNLIEVVTSKS
jgi:hypothetical protein